MADAQQTQQTDDIAIIVEPQPDNKYRLTTDSVQLSRIGDLLRGKHRFSIVNVIVIPLLVSLGTILFTSLFQYVSWVNSVRVQKTTERTSKATELYNKMATAIADRYYATLVFIPAIDDIADLTPHHNNSSNPNGTSNPDGISGPNASPNVTSSLKNEMYNLVIENDKQRIGAYYAMLKTWNVQYETLLTNIDYILDRPIFRQTPGGGPVKAATINSVDCSIFLPKAMEKANLDKHSLKLQFAVINHCFVNVSKEIGDRIKNLSSAPTTLDSYFIEDITKKLEEVRTSANVFRCYTLRRIEYYYGEREKSIISLGNVVETVGHMSPAKQRAEDHLRSADKDCAFGNTN